MNNISLTIPFPNSESATLALDVLKVDRELKGSGVNRELSAKGINLLINLHGADLKKLRVAVNALIKNVLLILKTLNQFS